MSLLKKILGGVAGGAGSVFGGIAGAVKEIWGAKIEKRRQQQEFENEVHVKRLENVKLGKVNEATWNITSIKKAGWRPGFLTILISSPLALVFIPGMVPYIEAGFAALEKMPLWYQAAVSAMIASAFGLKKLADHVLSKRYE